jgi:hypothetical protein
MVAPLLYFSVDDINGIVKIGGIDDNKNGDENQLVVALCAGLDTSDDCGANDITFGVLGGVLSSVVG